MSTAGAALLGPPRGGRDRLRRREQGLWIAVGATALLAIAAASAGVSPLPIAAVAAFSLTLVAGRRVFLAWPTLLGVILVIILFFPIRRYVIGGGNMPVELEPYRIFTLLVLGLWFLALAVDPAARWRKTALAAPALLFVVSAFLSLGMNPGRASNASDVVTKQLVVFATLFLVMFYVASAIDSRATLDRMVRIVVGGGAIVAICALWEWRTGENLFNGFGRYLPFLQFDQETFGEAVHRGSGVRALASAEHPIALAAMLVLIIPLAVYLYRRSGRAIWLVCATLLTLGAFSTGSRTAAVMLMSTLVVFFWLKRAEMVRLAPLLLPLLVVIQVAMPGTLGTFRGILQPSYVIQEQSTEMGSGSGRLADLGPSFAELAANPLFGQGFGTRVVLAGGDGGAQILDDQWLGTLLEVGVVGVLALAWLFIRAIRLLARRARASDPQSWLATSLAASLVAFFVGMFTFDAFGFTQVTFLAFVLLGFAAVLTSKEFEPEPAPEPHADLSYGRPAAPRA
jgi:O-antigen ligase